MNTDSAAADAVVTVMPHADDVDTTVRPCANCTEDIRYMLTRYGTREAFDTTALPATLSVSGVGWTVGIWPVRGRLRKAMAPLEHYPPAKQSRTRWVATTHYCRRLAAKTGAA